MGSIKRTSCWLIYSDLKTPPPFNVKCPPIDEQQALMGALAEDQKAIEGILEGERIRMEESFRSAAAARKARDEKHAEEDAAEDR